MRTGDGLVAMLVTGMVDYAIFVLDVDGNVLSWNAGAERLKGYQAEEIIGRHVSTFYRPEDVAAGKPQRELATASSAGRLEDEGWRVRKNGTRFFANVVITALRDASGLLCGYGKVTRDLGDGRAFDHPRSRALAGVGVWELDVVSGAMQWSTEHQSLYGVDPAKLRSSAQALKEIMHPEDREILSAAVETLVRDGTVAEARYRIVRPDDGTERWLRSQLHCQCDSDGTPVRVVGTDQDVTGAVTVLSRREREMLMLLAEGLSGEAIAEQFVLSPETVRTHIHNAMVKLGASTRGQAIATAMRSGEIAP